MALVVELTDDVLAALRSSEVYEIRDKYGMFVAVQNPWKQEVQLVKDDDPLVKLNNEDWLVAPQNFYGQPTLTVFSNREWSDIATPRDGFATPPPVYNDDEIDWNAPASPNAPNYGNLSQPYQQLYTPQGVPVTTKGQGASITGLVLSFFFPIVGLIISLVARNQAIKAQNSSSRTIATIGIAVGGLFTALWFLFIGVIFFSAFSSLASYDSDDSDYSYDQSATVPTWWSSANEDVLSLINSVEPGFRTDGYDETCEYSAVTSDYSNTTDSADMTTSDLAEAYRTQFQEHYPKAEVTLSSLLNNDDLRYYELSVGSQRDENYETISPDINVKIYDDSTSVFLNAYCN